MASTHPRRPSTRPRLRAAAIGAALLAAATGGATSRLGAQVSAGTTTTVEVRDEGGAPVVSATVVASSDLLQVRRLTSEQGRALLVLPRAANWVLEVRRIGFAPERRDPLPQDGAGPLVVTLRRTGAPVLDTVRVIADGPRRVRGVVVSSETQLPVAGARVAFLDGRRPVVTDGTGQFELPLDRRRNVALAVRAPGYLSTQRIERLDLVASADFVIPLEPVTRVAPRDAQNQFDLDQRLSFRGTLNAVVGRRELLAPGLNNLGDVAGIAPSLTEKGIRIPDDACIFVNGDPQPGLTAFSFAVQDIRMLEVYPVVRGIVAETLARRWPRGAPCGNGGSPVPPRVGDRPSTGLARFVVIWTL